MTKFTAPLVLALSVLSSNANADFLGLYVGGGIWQHDPVGTFGTVGDSAIDMETNLQYSGESDAYVYAAFEHFVPFVPNVRIESASMGHTGASSASVIFNGQTVNTGAVSEINIDNTDAIIYWRLLDNWVNFDFGFNARKLEGDFTVGNQSVSVSSTVPMLYLAAQFDLPFSGFSVGMDINNISYSDVSYQDVRIRALYEMGVFGVEAGLKTTSLELKGLDAVNADLEFKGVMVGAFLHF
ncbi:MAG: TIGR04219 family outer membrane beta-barrel protein [Gammaproteobacteria bacterium]|nr:TIGR04219 family outer membrane beta-barrel protein [Gammaproteobacteria bacterium]